MNRLVAIVGPTATGKSSLAVRLASRFNGEIIGADSRQVYRFMDIGTAKPGPEDLGRVPHHLIDIVNPDEEFSLAGFQELAYAAMRDIQARKKLPFLVGGTGLYVRAVLDGWQVPRVSPDAEFRYNKEKQAREDGIDELYAELVRIDPEAARKIDRRNVRRVIRALEVHAHAGKPFSEAGRKQPPDFSAHIIGLTASRETLYQRADARIDDMMAGGFVREVENLLGMGYDVDLPSMSGIGYRQVAQYLNGEMTREAAVQKIKTVTHRFIRHQYAWFRLSDETIHWYDIERQGNTDIEKDLAEYLNDI
ncbi:MAG: tRNA (adenosine(37)-N6)-dimethylallyltransferase MiaA [Dehalococcoidales bacterium]|nr:tRNA (adenosine(37)-N6)-dimethylallyltransferase MiaA [Dehalococcoidales bacterium]